eukprot:1143583-Pelagomonas_calceolata.AAC.1
MKGKKRQKKEAKKEKEEENYWKDSKGMDDIAVPAYRAAEPKQEACQSSYQANLEKGYKGLAYSLG